MEVNNFIINESDIYTEELIKITYLGSTSWVKITYTIDQQFPTYDDIILAAKQQFNILKECILLDTCDVIIPRDIFENFIKNYDRINYGFKLIPKSTPLNILDLDRSPIPPSPSSASTISSDCSWSFSESNDDNCPVKFPERKRLVENLLRKDLEQYIKYQKNIDVNGQNLLETYTKYKFLTTKDRIKVINIIADHIHLNNSHITRDDKILWAKATIQIFPCLRDETTEGKYEIVYDPKTRGGFLGNRLKTLSKILIKKNKIFNISEAKHSATAEQISNDSLEFHTNFLKSASTSSEAHDIKISLRATVHHRQSLIAIKESYKIPEIYPILLKKVELIDFEFELNQPGKCNKLLEFWNESNVHKIILSAEQSRNGLIENLGLCTSLKALFCLLTLCPPAVKGRGSSNKCGVATSFGKLVVLHEHNTSLEKETVINKQPYIIASGRNLNDIDNYYVAVDGNIVDTGNELKNAIDICFKVHYILNIEYDENLRILWGYIQHFIYQITLNQISTCMRMCNALLNNKIETLG